MLPSSPAIAQLVEHLTVDLCSNQMVPGSIPGGRMFAHTWVLAKPWLRVKRQSEPNEHMLA